MGWGNEGKIMKKGRLRGGKLSLILWGGREWNWERGGEEEEKNTEWGKEN